jgi:hypothetical protein
MKLKEDYITNHIVSRLLKKYQHGCPFEFDYYDFLHEIPRETVLEDTI